MKIFKTNNYKIDKKQDKSVIYINKTNDINYILNILYNCYSNKKTCIITDSEIRNPYHLIFRNPKFKKVSPGDCINA